eukprot:Gb_03150 [translate_table: standard]
MICVYICPRKTECRASDYRNTTDFCEDHPDVVLLCTSIVSTESTLRALPFQRLQINTLFVDVLSVKEFPRNLLLHVLPPEFEILCTHPMFGPESGKDSWEGLPFVYDKVRVSQQGVGAKKCNDFLGIFEAEESTVLLLNTNFILWL